MAEALDHANLKQRLESEPLGVLSSLSDSGEPQSAVVGYTSTDDLQLIIGTSNDSRKAHNIGARSRVSFVIYNPEKRWTIQLEGEARVLSREELEPYRQLIIDKNPVSATYIDQPSQVHIKIKPDWVRFSDVSGWPWKIQEGRL